MKLALAVHYEGEGARVAAVAFDDWAAPEAARSYTTRIAHVEKPARGEPDLRLVAFALQLLREHGLEPEVLLIDGFVHVDARETPGPGRHLHDALAGRCAVIGVSKTPFKDAPEQFEVLREEETAPLIVTCAGIDLGAAKARLRLMHGRKRMPTLLKLVARIAKGSVEA